MLLKVKMDPSGRLTERVMKRLACADFFLFFFVCMFILAGGIAFHADTVQAQRTEDLVFTETEAFKGEEGKVFYVKGGVKNVTENTTVLDIKITVRVYDKEGNLLSEKDVIPAPKKLRPGEEGAFEAAVPFDKRIYRYKKKATWRVVRR